MPYTSTPPGHTTPAAYDDTAPDSIDAESLTNTAPDATDAAARTSTAPGAADVEPLTEDAAGHAAPPVLTSTEPAATDAATLTASGPGATTLPYPTTLPAGTGVSDATPLSLPPMPSIFQPAFVELTGGATALAALNASAADAAARRVVQGTVNGQLKAYQVRVGADAQDLPGIVRPANFHAVTNAVVFVQL
jgi:hypothetical protein